MNLLRTILELDLPSWGVIAAKATVAILLALAVTALARHARASLRHAVYAALFALLLLLPFAKRVMPSVSVTVPVAVTPAADQRATPTTVIATARPNTAPTPAQPAMWRPSLMHVYFAGLALFLGSLLVGAFRLRLFARAGEVWLDGTRLATDVACSNGIRRAVLVVLSDEISVPMTFGFRRQTIVLPVAARDWEEASLRRALRHELEHVRRDDWAWQLVARAVAAIYWPHPLVWVALRRFCTEAERACDDAVVGAFEPANYAEQLVTLARSLTRDPHVPVLAMASPTRLSERVNAILDPSQRRGPHGRLAGMTTVVAMTAVLLMFGSLRVVGAVNEPAGSGHDDAVADGVRGGVRDGARDGVRDGVEEAPDDGSLDEIEMYREAVIIAASSGRIATFQKLLDRGWNINTSYDGDGSALLMAARNGKMRLVEFLLSKGADVNLPTPGDGNPLIAACVAGHVDVAELLLDRGARIDDEVPEDENPLISAARSGHAVVVRLLIRRGANVNARVWSTDNKVWRTPLNQARRNGHADVERILIEAGAKQ